MISFPLSGQDKQRRKQTSWVAVLMYARPGHENAWLLI